MTRRVFRSFPISLPNRVTSVDLIELDMLVLDIIFRMDWLLACFTSIYCRLKVVKFQFPNELLLDWKRGTLSLEDKSLLF